MTPHMRRNSGFSLVEVAVTIAIIGIMSAIAIPSFLSWLSDKGLHNASRDLYSNFRKAQMNAVKRNRNCAVTFDGSTGYVVYVDENRSFSLDAGEQVIAEAQWSSYRNVELDQNTFIANAGGDKTIAFRPNLLPSGHGGALGNGSVVLKNSTPRQNSVVVNVSGNISLR